MNSLLSGVVILDLSRMLAGPYGSLLMSDLGAEVIKIEDPDGGDPTRAFLEEGAVKNTSGYFMSAARGKKSVTLDLRFPKGREVFYDLVKTADVVFDNFRPSILKKLKITYEDLKQIKSDIICCSISSFGHTVENPDKPAFDLTIQALSGAMSVTGEPGRPPVRLGIPLGDQAGGMFAAFSIASALYHREKTGEGQKIDISLLDCMISLLSYIGQYYLLTGIVPQPIGSAHQNTVPYQAFKSSDGYFTLATYVPKFWEGVCRATDRMDLFDDPRFANNARRKENREVLIPILQAIFETRSTEYWIEALKENDVPCAPVNTVDKALVEPDVLARNMVVEIEHPVVGRHQAIGNPVKLSGVAKEEFDPVPLLGQHTDEVLRERLGYSEDRIAQLRAEKVI
ncbi:MAG: CoA transferase [Chloroflexi bacterium]|nr:CoA transferase [Chloroflexota bacterium]